MGRSGPEPRSDGATEPNAAPDEARATSDEYRARLERLVRMLIGRRFRTAKDLWRLQTRLLALQRDVQRSVAELKRSRCSPDELEDLRSVRWHARRLGDALAWVLLGLDRQYIYPLARNNPVPIPMDVHGSRGVQAIAEALAGAEWGFPLLHDITDCLRIGDLTFVRPTAEHTTIEVKTRLVGKRRETKGRAKLEYQITVVSLSQPPPLPAARGEHDDGPKSSGATEPHRVPWRLHLSEGWSPWDDRRSTRPSCVTGRSGWCRSGGRRAAAPTAGCARWPRRSACTPSRCATGSARPRSTRASGRG